MTANPIQRLRLDQIFGDAKSHFQYRTDMAEFGTVDYWESPDEIKLRLDTLGTVIGDCDDFASYAVQMCRQDGFQTRYVLCRTEDGDGHLVAEVDGYILDNRQMAVVSRDDLDYKWVAMSGFAKGDPWHLIQPD